MTVEMGTVWDRTTEFLSDNLGALLPVAVVAIWLPAAVSQVVAGALPQLGPGVTYLIMFLLTLPALWGSLFVIALAIDSDGGRAAAQRGASRAFVPSILAMLLLLAVWIVLALPIGIAFAASGIDMAALQAGSNSAFDSMSGGAVTFICLYGLALLGLIAFVGTRLALLYPLIVAEGGVVAALRRAFALTRGLFWRIFGVMILFGLVYAVAAAAVGSVFGLIFRLIAPGAGPFGVGAIVVGLLLGLVQMVYTLLIQTFVAKLYRAVTAGAATPA